MNKDALIIQDRPDDLKLMFVRMRHFATKMQNDQILRSLTRRSLSEPRLEGASSEFLSRLVL